MPKLTMPGALLVGDAGGMVDTVALKGVHHCIKSGMLAAESIYAPLKARRRATSPPTSEAVEESLDRQGALRGAQHAPAVPEGLPRRAAPLVNLMIATQGPVPRRALVVAPQRRASRCSSATAKDRYPKPDGKYTFDKLSSVYITGNATRDDAPNHIRVQKHVPREIAETWVWMCPAGVYEIPEDAPEEGNVDLIVNYTNCVQCGAITAKGGRLTTPEGGDGPLYQIT